MNGESDIEIEVVIVGGGFAGLRAARELADSPQVHVTLIDRKNHHLFQPLLYQVATAGLSPADIAMPIRSILAKAQNVEVVLGEVGEVDLSLREVRTHQRTYRYDYLILACGSTHSYFGHNHWARQAPGLKTIEDATEIRRRILLAFENAEIAQDPDEKKSWLHFVIVGGGPTGVELAGSISELSQKTLRRDFKHIDPRQTQITLVEAGPRLLSGFDPPLSETARGNLEEMGVEVLTGAPVTDIREDGVQVGDHWIRSHTVIWAAGVQAARMKITPSQQTDRAGRLIVNPDLSLPKNPHVFVCGDMAHFEIDEDHKILPGLAAVAMQEGIHAARMILQDLSEEADERQVFHYRDKGLMATIGRKRAVMQMDSWRMSGVMAWLAWLIVHVYYLIGFRNRLLVLLQWTWAYFTFKRGARLIVETPDATETEQPPSRPRGFGKFAHT